MAHSLCVLTNSPLLHSYVLVSLVVGEEFGKRDRLVVVHLDGCVQNAVVRLEIRPPVVSRH